jgi:hypothetical protein
MAFSNHDTTQFNSSHHIPRRVIAEPAVALAKHPYDSGGIGRLHREVLRRLWATEHEEAEP